MGRKVCPKCAIFSDLLRMGPGAGVITCKKCNGSGTIQNPKTWEYDPCPKCDGTGKVDCPKCEGSGWAED
jgi:DnaJ-class molecular chaperone